MFMAEKACVVEKEQAVEFSTTFLESPLYDNTTLLYTTAYETVYSYGSSILFLPATTMEHSLFPPFIVSHYV